MVKVHPNVIAYLNEFAGEPMVEQLADTIEQFMDSGRYVPEGGEKQDRGLRRCWWITNHHSLLLYITPPDCAILGVIDGEVRGRAGIEYYLKKFISNL